MLYETDGAGNLKTFYTRGSELINLQRTGEERYYLYDGHGSVRHLTDENGVVTDTYDYDAFGNLTEHTGDTENSYMYCGEQYDANTGFYYLRARYMNPATGTFISMDSYQGSLFDPVSLHKYLYANANPVMNSDPTGYVTLQDVMTAVSAMSALDKTLVVSMVVVGSFFININTHISSQQIELSKILNTIALSVDLATNMYIASEFMDNVLSDVIVTLENDINQLLNWFKEHTKGKRKSTKGKHQKGQTRRSRDAGGEKGDVRRFGNPNKRKP